MGRVILCFTCIVALLTPAFADKVKSLSPGVYEAYSRYNSVYFVANPAEKLSAKLKKDLVGSSSHGVDDRMRLGKGDKVKVISVKVFTQSEKRSAAVRADQEKVYYGQATKQKWKYGMARIRVLDGKHKGKTGWIKYAQMKVADSQGKPPKKNYYTSYLRKPEAKKK